MPRRTHYARLQKVEWRSGTCVCQSALVLTCLKAIEAHERGEAVSEPCPAGCAPSQRNVVVLNLSAWRSGEECACPACAPQRRETALVRQGLQRALSSGNEHDGASQQYSDGTAGPIARPSADPVGAPSGRDRGDVQCLPESAAAGRDVEPQSGPPRSSPPVYAPDVGAGEVLLGGRARDAVVEVGRRVSVPLGAPPPQLGPEDVVGGAEPHGPCGMPFCRHPLQAHRSWMDRLPCRYCGWPVTAHEGFDPVLAFGLPYASRRAMACGTYLSIAFEGGEHDCCTVEGCGCPGWRLRPPYVSEHDERIQALLAEKDRIVAEQAEELTRLRAEYEAAERELFRATSGPNDLGASPHGCPVYTEGESA